MVASTLTAVLKMSASMGARGVGLLDMEMTCGPLLAYFASLSVLRILGLAEVTRVGDVVVVVDANRNEVGSLGDGFVGENLGEYESVREEGKEEEVEEGDEEGVGGEAY
jgi:hypothetical protein